MIESNAELYSKANAMIEDIFLFKKERCEGLSLIETMIEYAFQKDIPIQEVGNVIADHKEYVEVFRQELVKDGYFRDESDALEKMQFDDEEW